MRVRLAGRCDACIVCDRPRRRDCGQGPRVRVVAQGRDAFSQDEANRTRHDLLAGMVDWQCAAAVAVACLASSVGCMAIQV